MQLGPTWTVLVIAQVALCLAGLPTAVEMAWGTLRPGILGPGFAAEEYLTARLVLDQETPLGAQTETDPRSFAAHFAELQGELVRHLESEAGIVGITVSAAVPGEEPFHTVEIERTPSEMVLTHQSSYLVASLNRVDDAFFQVFEIPLLAGRRFDRGDLEPGRAGVIVNRNLAQHLVGDENPLGLRIRMAGTPGGTASIPGPWHEIVGVVADIPANEPVRRIYRPMAPGQIHPASLSLRLGPSSSSVASRVRDVASALDPNLRADAFVTLDEVYREQAFGNNVGASTLAVVTLSILLLSAAGLYALMSFTINQRRHEIGIRSALGAQPHRLLAAVFRRALGQVGAGALIGVLVALAIDMYLPIEQMGGRKVPGALAGAAALMILIGILAALGPARRGLRVAPTEALRDS